MLFFLCKAPHCSCGLAQRPPNRVRTESLLGSRSPTCQVGCCQGDGEFYCGVVLAVKLVVRLQQNARLTFLARCYCIVFSFVDKVNVERAR
jgi:hypothetical protein